MFHCVSSALLLLRLVDRDEILPTGSRRSEKEVSDRTTRNAWWQDDDKEPEGEAEVEKQITVTRAAILRVDDASPDEEHQLQHSGRGKSTAKGGVVLERARDVLRGESLF